MPKWASFLVTTCWTAPCWPWSCKISLVFLQEQKYWLVEPQGCRDMGLNTQEHAWILTHLLSLVVLSTGWSDMPSGFDWMLLFQAQSLPQPLPWKEPVLLCTTLRRSWWDGFNWGCLLFCLCWSSSCSWRRSTDTWLLLGQLPASCCQIAEEMTRASGKSLTL